MSNTKDIEMLQAEAKLEMGNQDEDKLEMGKPEEDRKPVMGKQEQLCRCCNLPSMRSLPLHQPILIADRVTTLAALLNFCANLQVLQEEESYLPKHICEHCSVQLIQLDAFKRTALQTDSILRNQNAPSRSPYLSPSHAPSDAPSLAPSPGPATSQALEPEPKPKLEPKPDIFVDIDAEVDVDVGTDVNVDTEADVCLNMDAPFNDGYLYVMEETVGLDATGDPLQAEGSCAEDLVLEEISEEELHFDSGGPHAEIFELNYDIAGEDYEPDLDMNLDLEQHNIKVYTAGNVKSRKRRSCKAHNPALLCAICGKQLSTNNSYKYHIQLHGDNRPFVCDICGHAFKTRNAHLGHMTMHNPNNPNKCTECGKTYRKASSLRSHLHTHSGIKPFTCDICGKGLTQKSGYKKHLLIHTGEKPHPCDVCGRKFRFTSNLKAHKRSHERRESLTNPET